MRTLSMTLAATAALSLLLVAGCAADTARNLVARGSAPAAGLGRTILVVEVDHPAGTDAERAKAALIVTQAEQALDAVPGVSRLPAEALSSRLSGRSPMALSDGELAAAALDAGADSVALVQVLDFGGQLTISLLPPYWATGTDYAYHARVIDARTGALYLDAHRGRRKGGPFSAHGPGELNRDFSADMAGLFAGAAKTGSGS